MTKNIIIIKQPARISRVSHGSHAKRLYYVDHELHELFHTVETWRRSDTILDLKLFKTKNYARHSIQNRRWIQFSGLHMLLQCSSIVVVVVVVVVCV